MINANRHTKGGGGEINKQIIRIYIYVYTNSKPYGILM